MPDVSTELAGKVVAADLRNLIKKVGDGGTLTAQERQMFIAFTHAGDGPDDLAAARVNSLLKKWLAGARLDAEEKQEISHILPSSVRAPRTYDGNAVELAARLGLARKTFFTWKKHGETHGDPLPIHAPPNVPAWYERMKAKGVFKHRIPDNVLSVCGAAKTPPQPPGLSASSTAAPSSGETNGTFGLHMQRAPGSQGIGAEIQALERRVATLREASDAAYAKGDDVTGDQLRQKHQVELEKLRKLKKDAPKLLADDEESTTKSWVAEDIGAVFPAAIDLWMQEGTRFHRDCQSPLPRGEFMKFWRATVTLVCRKLATSKFAPPLQLEPLTSVV